MNRNKPQPGQRYRHFKGNLYQIITIAEDTETGKEAVVYQGLYEPFPVYVRPLDMFLSDTDKEKYPTATQSHRFEEEHTEHVPEGMNADLMAFLDADTNEARYEILSRMADVVDNHMIDTMAVVSDVVIEDGPIDDRYMQLKHCLKTKIQYEANRFR